jgi:glyoxylase-like metal-dependent hydrolase (beta-lactamase superfamily II)
MMTHLAREKHMGRFHRMRIGDADVVAVSDGATGFPADFLLVGVDEATRTSACQQHGFDPNNVPSQLNIVYVEKNGTSVLFDTGAGVTMPGCGRIQESLRAAGINPDLIDLVIHTHLHLDHICGNVDPDGTPMFPNSEYCVGQTEWDFWSDEGNLAGLDRAEFWNLPDFEPAMADAAREQILAISDRVRVFPDDAAPVPWVESIPAFGHTPGHLAFEVDLGDETLFVTGDLVLSPFHIENREWYPAVDLDPVAARASRSREFDRAAELNALVSCYHVPFPGFGRVTKSATGWNWIEESGSE